MFSSCAYFLTGYNIVSFLKISFTFKGKYCNHQSKDLGINYVEIGYNHQGSGHE